MISKYSITAKTNVTEGVASNGSYPISIQFDYLSSAVISNAMFTFKVRAMVAWKSYWSNME